MRTTFAPDFKMHNTRRLNRLFFALALVMLCGACQDPVQVPVEETAHAAEPTLDEESPQQAGTDALVDQDCGPLRELDALDPRRPVPLQPMMAWHQKQNMKEHLVAIERITEGLAKQDWEAVAAASALIESSPQMAQMCNHMGAGAEGFTELALDFHRRADKIGEAAQRQDVTAVLQATSHTLSACTSCHATYRQEVVDADTWAERAGSGHMPDMPHH